LVSKVYLENSRQNRSGGSVGGIGSGGGGVVVMLEQRSESLFVVVQ